MMDVVSDRKAFRLTVLNHLDEIVRAGRWLSEITERADLPAALAFRIDLCLAEALTNIVSYGYPHGFESAIDLELTINESRIGLCLIDTGHAFDPFSVADPVRPSRLDDASIGGWGVHLIRHYADRFEYRRRNGRNRLTLHWRHPSASRTSTR